MKRSRAASAIRAVRMTSLLLTPHPWRTPLEVAEWFGAMQAQDVASGLWSLGVRQPGSTVVDVEAAFASRHLVRSWPMRQTVHIVPANDLAWMLDLTGRRGLGRMIERRQGLGLLPRDLDGLESELESILASGQPVTRAAVLQGLSEAGIPTDGQRGYHMLAYSSLIGLTCIGPQQGGAQTFVLVSRWAPQQREFSREEALTELAFRYFRSHGPTTVQDFAGWSGLTLTDARRAVALNDGRLVTVDVAGEKPGEWWGTTESSAAVRDAATTPHATLALPGFDEYLLGYKDRSLHGDESLLERVVPGGNGIFRATIVRSGVAIATWTRTLVRDRVDIEVRPFTRLTGRARRETEQALGRYATYLQRAPRIAYRD